MRRLSQLSGLTETKTQTRAEEQKGREHLPSGNINIGSFVLSFTWSFNLEATRGKKRFIFRGKIQKGKKTTSGISICRAEILTSFAEIILLNYFFFNWFSSCQNIKLCCFFCFFFYFWTLWDCCKGPHKHLTTARKIITHLPNWAKISLERKIERTHLLVTRWRSFISALSNQTWGHDLTMALWMIPIKPPWTWPTWPTFKLKCGWAWKINVNAKKKKKKSVRGLHLYHSISSVIAEDQNVDRRGVIGHANSSFPRLILPVRVRKVATLSEAVPDLSPHSCSLLTGCDSGWRPRAPEHRSWSTSRGPIRWARTLPYARTKHTHKQSGTNVKESIWGKKGREMTVGSPRVWKKSNSSGADNQPGEADASQQHPTESKIFQIKLVNFHIFKLKGVSLVTSRSKNVQSCLLSISHPFI